jgi:hypothetical protein
MRCSAAVSGLAERGGDRLGGREQVGDDLSQHGRARLVSADLFG